MPKPYTFFQNWQKRNIQEGSQCETTPIRGVLGDLQNREYLAKSETQYSKEFIVDMIIL